MAERWRDELADDLLVAESEGDGQVIVPVDRLRALLFPTPAPAHREGDGLPEGAMPEEVRRGAMRAASSTRRTLDENIAAAAEFAWRARAAASQGGGGLAGQAVVVADDEALRGHLDALNEAGLRCQAVGYDANQSPFLIALVGPYADSEHVLFDSPWQRDVEWANGHRECDECGAHVHSIGDLAYPVTVTLVPTGPHDPTLTPEQARLVAAAPPAETGGLADGEACFLCGKPDDLPVSATGKHDACATAYDQGLTDGAANAAGAGEATADENWRTVLDEAFEAAGFDPGEYEDPDTWEGVTYAAALDEDAPLFCAPCGIAMHTISDDPLRLGCRGCGAIHEPPPAAAPGPEGEAVERVRAALADPAPTWGDVIDGYPMGPGRFEADLTTLLATVERLTADDERLGLARVALVATGYFTEDEVGPDVAPRITELWAARTEETTRLTQMLREARREREEARDLAFRAAFAPEEDAEVQEAPLFPATSALGVLRRAVGPWKPAPAPDSGGASNDG